MQCVQEKERERQKERRQREKKREKEGRERRQNAREEKNQHAQHGPASFDGVLPARQKKARTETRVGHQERQGRGEEEEEEEEKSRKHPPRKSEFLPKIFAGKAVAGKPKTKRTPQTQTPKGNSRKFTQKAKEMVDKNHSGHPLQSSLPKIPAPIKHHIHTKPETKGRKERTLSAGSLGAQACGKSHAYRPNSASPNLLRQGVESTRANLPDKKLRQSELYAKNQDLTKRKCFSDAPREKFRKNGPKI